jgi:site-specific DNA-methyltransferase (adenine-specific)
MRDPTSITHGVVFADCLGPEGLATLADKSVDHVITDPPYEAEAHTLQRRTKEDRGEGRQAGGGDRWIVVEAPLDFAPMTPEGRLQVAAQFARVARRWIVVFCQAEAVQAWREALEAAGARYKRACVWVKPDAQPQLTGDRPGMGYESIVVAHAPGRSRWNGGGRVGVYVENKNRSDLERTGHPTQKPIALMESLVRDFTDPGDLVLDAYAGSGTTGAACRRLGRRFLGFERDPRYHAMAERRISLAREQFVLPVSRGPEPKQASFAGVTGSAALKGGVDG